MESPLRLDFLDKHRSERFILKPRRVRRRHPYPDLRLRRQTICNEGSGIQRSAWSCEQSCRRRASFSRPVLPYSLQRFAQSAIRQDGRHAVLAQRQHFRKELPLYFGSRDRQCKKALCTLAQDRSTLQYNYSYRPAKRLQLRFFQLLDLCPHRPHYAIGFLVFSIFTIFVSLTVVYNGQIHQELC